MAGLGLIGTALAGAAAGMEGPGRQLGDYVARSTLQQEQEAAQKLRDERLNEMARQRDIEAEQRKRAPAIQAAKAAEGIIAQRVQGTNQAATDEAAALAGGGAPIAAQTALPENEEMRIRSKAYAAEGLTDAADRLSDNARDIERNKLTDKRLDNEAAVARQRHEDMVRRFDQQFEHQKRQDSIAAQNAARLTMIAEEQVKGIKLDNEQKQQLSDLDKAWAAAKDDKTREAIAERRAALTGKWNESFEVAKGKDEQGRDIVLGYIDKRRGTFTDNNGKVTDMRTGKAAGGFVDPFAPGAAARGGPNPAPASGGPAASNAVRPTVTEGPRPNADSGVSAYGPLTSWSVIEQQVRAGDPAAIKYAKERIAKGPGIIGVTPPDSLVEFLKSR